MKKNKTNNKKKLATAAMAGLGITMILGGAFAMMSDVLTHSETVTVEWVEIINTADSDVMIQDVSNPGIAVTELTPGHTYQLVGTLENDSTVITNWVATDLTTTPGMSVTIADADGNDANNQVGEDVDVSQFGITIQVDQTVTPSTDLNFKIQFSSSDARVMLSEPTAISEIFPDPAMAACVANDDESPAAGDVNYLINQDELDAITTLNCDDTGVANLEGMQYVTNLTIFSSIHGAITDLTPLANLTKLTSLNLGWNHITDISPLKNMDSLTTLILNSNFIVDTSQISNLTNLTYLNLNNNDLNDIESLSGLTNLTNLYLNGNNIENIDPLANMVNLTALDLRTNKISDISALSNMSNLVTLRLDNNYITDFSSLTYQPYYFDALNQSINIPDTTLGTTTPVVIDGINGEDLIITWTTSGTYENGQLTWENPGVNSLTYASADGTITGTITQTVN